MSVSVEEAFRRMGNAALYAADAVEGFVHEWAHKWDGPGGHPCSRCAVIAFQDHDAHSAHRTPATDGN
jgi:hypothetical protein